MISERFCIRLFQNLSIYMVQTDKLDHSAAVAVAIVNVLKLHIYAQANTSRACSAGGEVKVR